MVSSVSFVFTMHSRKFFIVVCLSACLIVGLNSVAAATADDDIGSNSINTSSSSSSSRISSNSISNHLNKRSVRSSASISDSISNINIGFGGISNSSNIGSGGSISSNIIRSNSNLLLGKLSLSSTRIQQCREGCLEKFAIRESVCQQRPECSMSGFPPYNYNSLPDALHLLCWDECAKPPPPKINKSIRETWALRTVSMLQQDSLVLVDVAWSPLNTPNQCLVTWEVSGGGLMGNLLTESSSVQLSLWPDTKYRVQVTCKNKKTGAMSRSLPLTIDTIEAIPPQERAQHAPSSSSSSASPSIGQQPSSSAEDHTGDLLFNHHTNFVFNWHNSNNDVTIDKIEPLDHPDIMTIAALSDMQKPLLFGVIAGTLLLALILCLYICLLRTQRISSDKKALIDDDGNATPPIIGGTSNHFGIDPSNSSIGGGPGVCNAPVDPAIYSRTVHVLTV